jgi:hypothetical protein
LRGFFESSGAFPTKETVASIDIERSRFVKHEGLVAKHSLAKSKKPLRYQGRGVAELVDARDLKSPGATEITHLSDLTRAGNPHEAGGDPAVLSNTPPPLPLAGRSSNTWADVFLTETSARSSTLRSLDKSARVEGTFSPSPTISKVTFAPAGQQDAAKNRLRSS